VPEVSEDQEKVLRRLDGIERNLSDQGKSITEIVLDHKKTKDVLDELRVDRAVRQERDKNLDDRLNRIENDVSAIKKLGMWILTAIGSGLVLAILNFIIKGGLKVV